MNVGFLLADLAFEDCFEADTSSHGFNYHLRFFPDGVHLDISRFFPPTSFNRNIPAHQTLARRYLVHTMRNHGAPW